MISDEERKKAVKFLRERECVKLDCHECHQMSEIVLGRQNALCAIDEQWVALADLIDRPTCRDVGGGYTFECSNCGCRLGSILMDSHEGEPAMTVHDEPLYVPHCCPNCGAEVVE